MFYKLFGFFIRREACRLSALALQGEVANGDIAQRLWSLTVFFEKYMCDGADGTHEDFGPKEPVTLHTITDVKSQ